MFEVDPRLLEITTAYEMAIRDREMAITSIDALNYHETPLAIAALGAVKEKLHQDRIVAIEAITRIALESTKE
jgi:hypothetical protein